MNTNNEILDTVKKLSGKGCPILLVGTTGSGKSLLIEACAKDSVTRSLLSVRTANGKGSTTDVTAIITDAEKIPDDKLIFTAELNCKTIAECSDDNDFLGNIVFSSAKSFYANPDETLYREKLSSTLAYHLQHPANDTLAYKLKSINDEGRAELCSILLELPIPEVMNLYNEMLAKNPKKGQSRVRIFVELLSVHESFKSTIEKFWGKVIELINLNVQRVKAELINSGAYEYEESIEEGSYKFVVALGKEDIGKEIVNILLKSKEGSKEYLFSNITLIFRGADWVFNPYPNDKSKILNTDSMTISEIDGTKIHCIRIIDTQGLFHSAGVEAKDESERIVDLLSQYHSNRMALVVNSYVNDTVKDGYDAITMMLREMNREIDIYLIFTHWDEYLKGFGDQSESGDHFEEQINIQWEKKFDIANNEQEEISSRFREAIESNISKRKPQIIGSFKAALLTSSINEEMKNVLKSNKIGYYEALKCFIFIMTKRESERSNKYRVSDDVIKCAYIDASQLGKSNIYALYTNLVRCKGLKLYASTVRACVRKWTDIGDLHKSYVVANDYDFENIETSFVRDIRNYAMSFVNKIKFNVDPYLINKADKDYFIKDLTIYLTDEQNVGREAAKIIGKIACEKGFKSSATFKYQYQRFEDMLQYVQNNYFSASSIDFSNAFEKCLIDAVNNCVVNFVNSNCIVVY